MPEREVSVLEVKRSPRAKMLAATVLAGLALAACTAGTGSSVEASSTSTSTRVETSITATTSAPEKSTTHTLATATNTPSTKTREVIGLAGCVPYTDLSKYKNHEYEVCTAYIANAAGVALQGMYKYGNNRYNVLSDAAKHHFETRYWEQPRTAIEKEVASWPVTNKISGNKVKQTIILRGLSSNLKADRGFVRTQESWRVSAPDGTVLLDQPFQNHEATMCRGQLPGHPLHLWMVVSDKIDTSFDCIKFDTDHGLDP